jgi:hypothetical protein
MVWPPGSAVSPAAKRKRRAMSGLPAATRRRQRPVRRCRRDNGLVARPALCTARSQGFRHYAEFRVAIC